MGRITTRRRVTRVSSGGLARARVDVLAVEEPLEVRHDGQVLTVTMRTPGDDIDLVTGWLVAEGVIQRADQVRRASYCPGTDDQGRQTYNVLELELDAPVPHARHRQRVTSSACGACGASSLDALRIDLPFDVNRDETSVDVEVLLRLPDLLRGAQRVFDQSGGVHAAGLFTVDGELLCIREDVGRHNAVDKVVGWAARESRLPLTPTVLQVSGRASFELVQKAAVAGVPVLAAVSAPSSLAVELAAEVGVTLAGFVRDGSLNLYAHPERVRIHPGR